MGRVVPFRLILCDLEIPGSPESDCWQLWRSEADLRKFVDDDVAIAADIRARA